ncbi:MAG: T9SS type A sorting domain-containing protein [Bacteroidota bacterium]
MSNYLTILALLIAPSLQSQNFIPLRIDSLHYWYKTTDYNGQPVISESSSAYTYNTNDSLIQIRTPFARNTYSYTVDTVYMLTEKLGTDNTWKIFNKTTTVNSNGKIKSEHFEDYINNAFVNNYRYLYFYNAAGLDTLKLGQDWENNTWVNAHKETWAYDLNGNIQAESEYYVDANGNFYYDQGSIYEYDNAGNRTQQIDLSGPDIEYSLVIKKNWVYGNDNLLDTLKRCNFHYTTPTDYTCENILMTTIGYQGQDTIEYKHFNWDNQDWKYTGKDLSFTGPGIYSNKPDSIISYFHSIDSLFDYPHNKRYITYLDLGNNKVYFKDEQYFYSSSAGAWFLWGMNEEWYHIKGTTGISDKPYQEATTSMFPNPCKAGQEFTFLTNKTRHDRVEIIIFDMQGRLILKQIGNNSVKIPAPQYPGNYIVLMRNNAGLIGLEKLIIVE